jgi:hypothetical protein
MKASLYQGALFTHGICAIVAKHPNDLAAIRAFCESDEFCVEVRKLDQKVCAALDSVAKVPFDLARWGQVAAEKYPHGLPTPFSSDPTQWLFNGHPAGADQPLHVTVARLLGYQWPRQTGSSFPDSPALGPDGLELLSDDDGIVCLPPLNRERPAAARLRALLAASFGKEWSTRREHDLLSAVGSSYTNLEDWLCDEFFELHCSLFHQRPFVWHIWDGRKDGFAALVNYHKLDHELLKKLTYSYLGDWIRQQQQEAKADKPGAAERLGAAQALQTELANILTGEPPCDLFVRWKPLAEQALGWHPDLNDGVRLNIRPFMQAADMGKKGAGVLRAKPNIKWEKDRGKEPERPKEEYPWFWSEEAPGEEFTGSRRFAGHRWNDVHYSLDAKRTARRNIRR